MNMRKMEQNLIAVGIILIIRGIISDGIMKAGVAFGIMFFLWGLCEIAASKEKMEETTYRRYNRRKWKEELFYLKTALLGGTFAMASLFIEFVPDKWVVLLKPMFLPGLAVFVISFVGFFEVRDGKKNTRKKRRHS